MISESGTTQSTIKKLPRTKSHKVEFVWHAWFKKITEL